MQAIPCNKLIGFVECRSEWSAQLYSFLESPDTVTQLRHHNPCSICPIKVAGAQLYPMHNLTYLRIGPSN